MNGGIGPTPNWKKITKTRTKTIATIISVSSPSPATRRLKMGFDLSSCVIMSKITGKWFEPIKSHPCNNNSTSAHSRKGEIHEIFSSPSFHYEDGDNSENDFDHLKRISNINSIDQHLICRRAYLPRQQCQEKDFPCPPFETLKLSRIELHCQKKFQINITWHNSLNFMYIILLKIKF